jgi:1-phosphofructokinase family hexose kinase
MLLCLGVTPTVQRTMTFDRVTVDGVNRATAVEQYASGKAVNAAHVLHTLGHPALAIGFLGGDAGKFIRDDLDRNGIAHDFQTVTPNTRLCVTVVDRSMGTATELVEESSPVPPEAYEALLDQFNSLLPQARGVILSGTLTPGGPQDFYARCVAAATRHGLPVVLDAKGEPLRQALAQKPMIVKPNRVELEATVGMTINSDESLKEAIHRLIEQGPRWVVVTHGAGATVASDGNSFWQISSPKVAVVNPIGSGDSFAAGLMAAVAQGRGVPEACRLAVACGAANAMTSRAGYLRTEDVEALLPGIGVSPF